jgi:hypothetical protein
MKSIIKEVKTPETSQRTFLSVNMEYFIVKPALFCELYFREANFLIGNFLGIFSIDFQTMTRAICIKTKTFF